MTQHLKDAFLRFYLDFEILSEAVHKIVHLHIDSGERIGRQAKHLNHWTMSCIQSPSVVPVLRPALPVSAEFVELILPQKQHKNLAYLSQIIETAPVAANPGYEHPKHLSLSLNPLEPLFLRHCQGKTHHLASGSTSNECQMRLRNVPAGFFLHRIAGPHWKREGERTQRRKEAANSLMQRDKKRKELEI